MILFPRFQHLLLVWKSPSLSPQVFHFFQNERLITLPSGLYPGEKNYSVGHWKLKGRTLWEGQLTPLCCLRQIVPLACTQSVLFHVSPGHVPVVTQVTQKIW